MPVLQSVTVTNQSAPSNAYIASITKCRTRCSLMPPPNCFIASAYALQSWRLPACKSPLRLLVTEHVCALVKETGAKSGASDRCGCQANSPD